MVNRTRGANTTRKDEKITVGDMKRVTLIVIGVWLVSAGCYGVISAMMIKERAVSRAFISILLCGIGGLSLWHSRKKPDQ